MRTHIGADLGGLAGEYASIANSGMKILGAVTLAGAIAAYAFDIGGIRTAYPIDFDDALRAISRIAHE